MPSYIDIMQEEFLELT